MTPIAKFSDVYETSNASLLVDDPLVSVIVLTYNHGSFLREAVSSVVSQIIPFPIEAVIAEDHSSDDTLQVALALQRENPAIVRVIHGPVNIGMIPNVLRAIDHCRGDYIAICEGDDFWTDPHKLARQIAEMKRRPEIGVCITRGSMLSPDGSMQLNWNYGGTTRLILVREILKRGGGIVAPTASMVWRAERLRLLPDWFKNAPVGDLFMLLAGATPGGALYLPVDTVAYRIGIPGSWTDQFTAEWEARKVAHSRRMLEAFDHAIVSFGLNPRWIFANSAHYVLLRQALADGDCRAALAHLRRIAPGFVLRQAIQRLW